METKTTIISISHDDLVTLLSTACCGSSWLGVYYDTAEYRSLSTDDDDCIEDKCAKLLLAGKSIILYDMYAEDKNDFYGNLSHHYDDDGDMCYTVTLSDIKKGLQKCFDGKFKKNDGYDNEVDYIRKCMKNFMTEDGYDFDQPQAENLVQIILFGQLIYG